MGQRQPIHLATVFVGANANADKSHLPYIFKYLKGLGYKGTKKERNGVSIPNIPRDEVLRIETNIRSYLGASDYRRYVVSSKTQLRLV